MARIKSKRKEEEAFDHIAEIIDNIRCESNEGAVIVVEGKKDERVLRSLGIKGRIVKYSEAGRMKATKAIEDFWKEKIIVLTDFDPEGEKILRTVEKASTQNGVNVDKYLRKRLFEAVHLYTSTLEGLERIAERVMERRPIG
ncbi:MAG: toprim domain-containing protein [Nitrososphaeria archaeon]|nr:toprim domain-containing protein [Nitrososphaeria archaeon]NIN52672.1 toprim domain-containing protein [Nitrososphaeria archaeon]NIQ33147.1 toprim domain-containing protein [Nitrososphaeria archaeon]